MCVEMGSEIPPRGHCGLAVSPHRYINVGGEIPHRWALEIVPKGETTKVQVAKTLIE